MYMVDLLKDCLTRRCAVEVHGQGKVIAAIPHSGTGIPMKVFNNVYDTDILDDCDIYTDRIYDLDYIVKTNVHRDIIDCNRNENPFRTETFSGRGFMHELTDEQKAYLMNNVYRPFHNALRDARFVLNGHAMDEHDPMTKERRPGFCIGHNCQDTIVEILQDYLEPLAKELDTNVSVNYPFEGKKGITKKYNSVLLEVNKGLYTREKYMARDDIIKRLNTVIKQAYDELNQKI